MSLLKRRTNGCPRFRLYPNVTFAENENGYDGFAVFCREADVGVNTVFDKTE